MASRPHLWNLDDLDMVVPIAGDSPCSEDSDMSEAEEEGLWEYLATV